MSGYNIDSIGSIYNPYMNDTVNNPYFWAAYQTQGPCQNTTVQASNSPSFQGVTQTANTTGTTSQQQTIQENEVPSSRKKWVFGAILAVGATALCIAAHKRGAAHLDLLPRIGDGLKRIGNDVASWFKKIKNPFSTLKETEKNGKKICNIPGRTNRFNQNFKTELEKIGENMNIRPLVTEGSSGFAEGSNLRSYLFNLEKEGVSVQVRNGNIQKILDKDGKNVLNKYINSTNQEDSAVMQKIKDLITKFGNGEELDLLKNIRYSNVDNGVTRLYSMENIKSAANLDLVVTKDFPIDSHVVTEYKSSAS